MPQSSDSTTFKQTGYNTVAFAGSKLKAFVWIGMRMCTLWVQLITIQIVD